MSSPSVGSFEKWHRRKESGVDSREPAKRLTAGPPPELKLPPDSDVQEGAIRASQPGPRPIIRENYTEDGTYIPLSGGMRGWYENSGVPRSEQRNHYRLTEAVDGDAFKRTILERIETFNRRGADRFQVQLWVLHSDPDAEGAELTERAFCVDLSVTGAKLRMRREVKAGQFMALQFFRKPDDIKAEHPAVSVVAEVVHGHPAPATSGGARFYAGIHFQELEIAAKERLAELTREGTPL